MANDWFWYLCVYVCEREKERGDDDDDDDDVHIIEEEIMMMWQGVAMICIYYMYILYGIIGGWMGEAKLVMAAKLPTIKEEDCSLGRNHPTIRHPFVCVARNANKFKIVKPCFYSSAMVPPLSLSLLYSTVL